MGKQAASALDKRKETEVGNKISQLHNNYEFNKGALFLISFQFGSHLLSSHPLLGMRFSNVLLRLGDRESKKKPPATRHWDEEVFRQLMFPSLCRQVGLISAGFTPSWHLEGTQQDSEFQKRPRQGDVHPHCHSMGPWVLTPVCMNKIIKLRQGH